MNTTIKTILNNTYQVLKTLQEHAWQSKIISITIVVLLVAISLISCQEQTEEAIHYRFPNRIDAIEGERFHITDIKYKIALFESNDKSNCPSDSVIVFRKNGKIFNSQREIGYWKKDGSLYLDDFKKRFFFNWITPKNCNRVQLFSIYTIGNTKDIKRIWIFTKDVLEEKMVRNEENAFDL